MTQQSLVVHASRLLGHSKTTSVEGIHRVKTECHETQILAMPSCCPLAIGLLVLAFRPRPADVDLATIERGTLCVTVDEDGKTRIKERYVVSSPLAGRLLRIEMEPGDAVTRGSSLLAVLQPRDPSLLDARELAASQARVSAQESALDRAKAEVERTRAAMEFAESDLARSRQAPDGRVISKDALERAIMLDRQSQESYRAARFAEDMARYELELAARHSWSPKAKIRTTQTDAHFEIHSPITGRVLRVFQESATVVTAGSGTAGVRRPRRPGSRDRRALQRRRQDSTRCPRQPGTVGWPPAAARQSAAGGTGGLHQDLRARESKNNAST